MSGDPTDFERLLVYLRSSRGFDFSSYKRTTLSRRVEKRMQTVGVADYDAYQDYLEVHQEEFQQLFNTILINVTSFFRDAEAWGYVAKTVVPSIIAGKADDEPIRIWVAGCASGEEACTISMVLSEALGATAFRQRVKIYATDLDDEALGSSRAASYSAREIESVPGELLKKYFERVEDRFVFDRELRRSIIFGRHDLIQDAPISRVDLLLCRNTLMYFNAEVQERILNRFHFALNEDGYLFLGRAETMLTHTDIFAVADLKNRVFTKVARGRVRDRGFMFSVVPSDHGRPESARARLRDAALEASGTAQVVLDAAGRLILANERARALFPIGRRDLGTPFQDLDLSFRPVELRSGIEQSLAQKRSIRHKGIAWTTPSGEALTLDVTIATLKNEDGDVAGTSVVFEDVTAYKRMQLELHSFKQELETAYEEVQSTNEELQTTNEELQSTVEELETTNEELQSTNEELETMNEEISSANEELETINEELRQRSNDLNRANSFLEAILSSLRDSVIVLDSDLQILAWNFQSEDLWGLRADEVLGKHLLNLDAGLQFDSLRNLIRTCLATMEPQETRLEATNRRGRRVECSVVLTPLRRLYEDWRGVIVLTSCTKEE